MSTINRIAGDILKKINPDAADILVIARHIKTECGNKRIIICACDDFAARLDKRLTAMGLTGTEYFIAADAPGGRLNGKEIKAVETLMYEDSDNIYLALTASGQMHRILGRLIELGFTPDKLHVFCNANIPGGSRLLNVYDVNLGFTRIDDIPGFTIFDSGADSRGQAKIVVTLGGSTTDATFANVMSWSEMLWHKLIERGIGAVIYCGGIAAANSTQELIKCIRDVIPMKPDAVLVYSGINDIKMNESKTPFVLDYQEEIAKKALQNNLIVNNKAYRNVGRSSRLVPDEITTGLPNEKPYSQYWIDNMRLMHAACAEFGIPFHAFLQPNAYVGSGEISFHRELLADEAAAGYRRMTLEMSEGVKDIDYITDLTHIMDGQMQWYMDDCHVLEPGNRIIADAILPFAVEMLA